MQLLHRFTLTQKLVFSAVLLLIILSIGGFILARNAHAPAQTPGTSTPTVTPGQATIEGTIVCLPKKGNGPHTLECAYGLRDNTGKHYGLTNLGSNGQLQINTRVRVSGEMKAPPADTSYDISGTLDVNSLEVISVPS